MSAVSNPYQAIYLSPHLDDAVLSCGGQLAARVRRGERVLVATLGAGGHVDHRLVRLAAEAVHGAGLLYYEDYPYAAKWRAVRRRAKAVSGHVFGGALCWSESTTGARQRVGAPEAR